MMIYRCLLLQDYIPDLVALSKANLERDDSDLLASGKVKLKVHPVGAADSIMYCTHLFYMPNVGRENDNGWNGSTIMVAIGKRW